MTRARAAAALLPALLAPLLTASTAGCLPAPAAREARPAAPLAPHVIRAYRPQDLPLELSLEPLGPPARSHEVLLFRFQRFSESSGDFREVVGRYYRARPAPGRDRTPLLVQCPILAGAVDDYLSCRVFGVWAAAEGISSFFIHQEEDILTAGRGALELERSSQENIRDVLAALDLLCARPEVDAGRLGLLGISLGAIRSVPIAAVEPRLSAVVLCLGGEDVPQILLDSRERGVRRYRERRRSTAGMGADAIAEDFRRYFRSDPIEFAGSIDPRSVLLFLGSLDDKVPFDQGLRLRRDLGTPRTYVLPVGHYTGIPLAPFVAFRAFEFLEERWSLGAGAGGADRG